MQEKQYQGEISVTTEHIFPIIKRWLYSDKDIFLREIVSNASDAITKLGRLVSLGEAEKREEGRITVELDEENKTLTVRDNGIGMTAEEVDRYLNRIALSGALEFIEKYEGEEARGDGIIGHFGLGFYSAFMVASEVEVRTKSYTDAAGVHWTCTDAGVFSFSECELSSCGTEVILHVTEEEAQYLKREKCLEILKKYCAFLAYPIYLVESGKEEEEPAPINETSPLWLKNASEVSEEDYRSFYHQLFGYGSEPLFWVHLNADYPLNFKGILYFPRLNHRYDSMEGEVKLFYNRVFVADNISEVVPEYLLSLKGVLDCPELPLNVSRSFLQNSPYVSKLSAHIAKKVADKLSELFRSDRSAFEGFSEDLRPFLQYGAVKDAKFFSRVRDLILFPDTEDGYFSVSEYLSETESKKIYYTTDSTRQAQYVRLAREKGNRVLVLPGVLDAQYISFLEQEEEGVTFVRVDSDPDDFAASDAEENESLRALFAPLLGEVPLSFVRLENTETPALFVTSENERRFADLMRAYRAAQGEEMKLPGGERFCINLSCPVCEKLAGAQTDRAELVAKQIYYTALLALRALTAEEMEAFLENNYRILDL